MEKEKDQGGGSDHGGESHTNWCDLRHEKCAWGAEEGGTARHGTARCVDLERAALDAGAGAGAGKAEKSCTVQDGAFGTHSDGQCNERGKPEVATSRQPEVGGRKVADEKK